jgi:hypothetical protein
MPINDSSMLPNGLTRTTGTLFWIHLVLDNFRYIATWAIDMALPSITLLAQIYNFTIVAHIMKQLEDFSDQI